MELTAYSADLTSAHITLSEMLSLGVRSKSLLQAVAESIATAEARIKIFFMMLSV
jgi:hypothetical protein